MEEARLMLDWQSAENHLLLNPRLPADERRRLEELAAAAPLLEGHVFIASSGTSGSLKLVALSKDAILASAAAVNQHLGATSSDAWCCVLPTFHVGGLGIHARASLSGARVVSMTWEPHEFARACAEERIALSALVQAQVHDLVRARLRGPESLRAIVVGGAAFAKELYLEARELGWPVLPSYGMTECCSQAATALGDSAEMILLPHLEARAEEDDGRLAIRGSSLLTGYCLYDERSNAVFLDPKVDGWFVTEDIGEVDGRVLRVSGRRGEFVKIGGESVDLRRLDGILEAVVREVGGDAAVFTLPDERLGHVIHLAVAGDSHRISALFNVRVLPFERARVVHRIDRIPRTPLGKLVRGLLPSQVNQ
jgi:o-succinylbenzoate---CoA ligase